MLKKWIEEIRKHSNLYKTDSWKYHISGNVIEISILPAYLKDKNNYRCSVIAVGQVLKALSCYIERNQSNFHIQSFPSLENPGVVASIRIDVNSTFVRNSTPSKDKSHKKSDPEKIIQTLARQYQLDIKQIEQTEILQGNGLSSSDFELWFALYSTFNNPFTWLNVGYWKESIQNDCHDHLSPNEFRVIDFCVDDEAEKPNLQSSKNRYLQSLIGLNSTVTTG